MGLAVAKAAVTFRIGVTQWLPERRFEDLLDLFRDNPGVTDDLALFTSDTHPPLPLDVMEARSTVLSARIIRARERGYRVGINVLATIGHHNENLANSLDGDFTWFTGIDGTICRGCLCPNDERARGYIAAIYRHAAAADPDHIWVDDDVRLSGHAPVRAGCFCDRCLAIFEEEFGTRQTRASVLDAFNAGPVDRKLEMRRQWLAHNRNTMARLLTLVEETVHAVRPALPLGFMTGDRFYEGYDFGRWSEALSGPGASQVLWRPGGGFYSDDPPSGLLSKAHDIGRQVSMLPTSVVRVQSEVENFPYQRLKKSEHATALEAAAYIAAGCTGTAFNVLSMFDEPLDEYAPLVARLKKVRPFLDLLAECFGRYAPAGLYTGWSRDTAVAANLAEGDWLTGEFDQVAGAHGAELYQIGIPPAYSPANACVTLLAGAGVAAMSDDEIRRAFSSAVYMDGPALVRLEERGLGDLAGFSVERFVDSDCIEEQLAHPLSDRFVGWRRDGRQSFWRCPAAILHPRSAQAVTLARTIDYAGLEVAACGMGLFENALGGRVCVAGYYPWTFLQSLSKACQLKALMRWLSRNTLPAYVSSYHKINLWSRRTAAGWPAVAMINVSLDPAREVNLTLRGAGEEVTVFDMDCAPTRLRAVASDGPYRRFVLPPIGAWEMRLVR